VTEGNLNGICRNVAPQFLKKSAIAGGAVTLEGLAPVRMANPQAASAQTPAVTPSNDKVKLSSPTDGEVLQTA